MAESLQDQIVREFSLIHNYDSPLLQKRIHDNELQLVLEMSKTEYDRQDQNQYSSNPLTTEQIRRLKRVKYKSSFIIIDNDDNSNNNNKEEEFQNTCAICLEIYENEEELIKLKCNHHYHPICITQWFKMTDTCPLCKYKIE